MKVTTITLDSCDKALFVEKVEHELKRKFGDSVPDNYDRTHPWSLLSLIDSDKIDNYIMVYVNDTFWAGCGGMVRDHNNQQVYQCGFRGFSNHQSNNSGMGIGSKSLMYSHCIMPQIERAKQLNCDSAVMSFNDYNFKLFDIVRKYHIPKVFGYEAFIASKTPVLFNGVPQWLLTMSLK